MYSDEVMFGSTPFKEALDKAAIRFIDKKYAQHEKLFVVISDGNFGEENAFIVSINLLKRRGVTILSCLISEKNILSHLVKKPMKRLAARGAAYGGNGIKGIRRPEREISRNGVRKADNGLQKRSCVCKINHSNVLEDVIEGVFE